MQTVADKIIQLYETNSPEIMNELGEMYFGLAQSSVVQNNTGLKLLFKEDGPVVNHSLALSFFKMAARKNNSAVSEKGWLALGLRAYFSAAKEKNVQKKAESFQKANDYLKIVGDKHPDIIPATISANLGLWSFKENDYKSARYWLRLVRRAHLVQPVLNADQYIVMQNYRAMTITKNTKNFKHFCEGMKQKGIPFSREVFLSYMKELLSKELLSWNETQLLAWMYKSKLVTKQDKKSISLKLVRQYCDRQDWFMALHWAGKNGNATLRKEINNALDKSMSKLKLYLLTKYQIAAGMLLLLCGALATFPLNPNDMPQIAITGLVALVALVFALIILYLRAIKRKYAGFLWGLGQLGCGIASLTLLKPTARLGETWQHFLVPGIFSLAYFLMLLSMPEMFKFNKYIYRLVIEFFNWSDNQ